MCKKVTFSEWRTDFIIDEITVRRHYACGWLKLRLYLIDCNFIIYTFNRKTDNVFRRGII